MESIFIIEKNGNFKSSKSKGEKEYYKKAGFSKPDGFQEYHQWEIDDQGKKRLLRLFGKTTGRAGHENKYDFPPPMDNTLFFGSCILVYQDENENYLTMTETKWKKIYEGLFGGFEDIGDEDSEEEEEEEDEELPRTKQGYVKDGFVVDENDDEDDEDDEDEEEEEYDEEEDEDEEQEIKIPKKRITTRSVSKKIPDNVFIMLNENIEQELECTSELSEDSYDSE